MGAGNRLAGPALQARSAAWFVTPFDSLILTVLCVRARVCGDHGLRLSTTVSADTQPSHHFVVVAISMVTLFFIFFIPPRLHHSSPCLPACPPPNSRGLFFGGGLFACDCPPSASCPCMWGCLLL
eukprot:NODE_5833_length_485_cov_62.506881_g4377_i0.p1 GENE.NODE_5833_length_485_cov_62.506881_g4377_i0~~NODE_5833_length_485_cov_62.506881_g4377_i0.p1  ORF type:complete len:133 (+),score=8.74 NODE_5833_length_485_cov_62.506881_g4377_i0:26-400(+)